MGKGGSFKSQVKCYHWHLFETCTLFNQGVFWCRNASKGQNENKINITWP